MNCFASPVIPLVYQSRNSASAIDTCHALSELVHEPTTVLHVVYTDNTYDSEIRSDIRCGEILQSIEQILAIKSDFCNPNSHLVKNKYTHLPPNLAVFFASHISKNLQTHSTPHCTTEAKPDIEALSAHRSNQTFTLSPQNCSHPKTDCVISLC